MVPVQRGDDAFEADQDQVFDADQDQDTEVGQEETGLLPGAGEVAQEAEALKASSSLVADEAADSSLVEERGGLVDVIQRATGRPPDAGEVGHKVLAPRKNLLAGGGCGATGKL